MILDILRQVFTTVQTFFQLGVSDIATYDDRTVQRQTGSHRIFIQFFQDLCHRLVQVDLDSIAFACLAQFCRDQFARMAVQLLDPDTVFVDLTFHVTVGRTTDTQTDRTGSAVPRQTDDTDIMCQILSAELCSQTDIVNFGQHFFFQFYIPESTAILIAGRRQFVIIMCRSQLHRQQVLFGRSSADNHCDMIRGTSSRTQCLDLFDDEGDQSAGIQDRLCFLIQVSLIGGTATLCHTQELIFHTFRSFDIDLGGEVAFGVHFVVHVQGSVLRIAQVLFRIGFIYTQRKCLFIAVASPHLLSLFAVDDSRTGILTERKYTLSSNFCVTQESQRYIFIVITCFRITQDLSHLLVVRAAKHKGNITESGISHCRKTFFRYFQNRGSFELGNRNIIFCKQIILCCIRAQWERSLILERSCCHSVCILIYNIGF